MVIGLDEMHDPLGQFPPRIADSAVDDLALDQFSLTPASARLDCFVAACNDQAAPNE